MHDFQLLHLVSEVTCTVFATEVSSSCNDL